jgi:hypothetical protein
MDLLRILGAFSRDAQLVYVAKALQSPGSDGADKQCIRSELERAVNRRVPTSDMIRQWTGMTSE